MDHYKITFKTWENVAEKYQEVFMDLDLYNDTYQVFCNRIEKPGAEILEIGCGPGNITKYLLSVRPDLGISGIDIAPNMIRLARKNNPAANFEVMDCREINKIGKKFDGIVCGFCMPYLSREDCTKLMNDCYELLNTGGIFYFSTIEGDYARSGFETGSNSEDKMFVYYYDEEFLMNALKENGFKLLELSRKDFKKADETTSTHLIFIAGK